MTSDNNKQQKEILSTIYSYLGEGSIALKDAIQSVAEDYKNSITEQEVWNLWNSPGRKASMIKLADINPVALETVQVYFNENIEDMVNQITSVIKEEVTPELKEKIITDVKDLIETYCGEYLGYVFDPQEVKGDLPIIKEDIINIIKSEYNDNQVNETSEIKG